MNELLDHCHGLQEGSKAIVTYLSPQKKCPSAPDRLVRELSRAPAYVKAWKESSFRHATIRVIALVCSYYPTSVEHALLTLGKPEKHENGSPFTKEDFESLQKSLRPFACQIIENMDSEIWTHRYDSNNQKIVMATPPVVEFGCPSQLAVGASTSTGPTSSTPTTPVPARVRPEDAASSQNPGEGAAPGTKDPSAPGSSAQGPAANAPASTSAPAQQPHALDDF